MKTEFLNSPLVKNEVDKHFEMKLGEHLVFIAYSESENIMELIRTKTPEAIEGNGAATAIVEKTLKYLDENEYQLAPMCPFVYTYIQKNPEWKRIVHKGFLNI